MHRKNANLRVANVTGVPHDAAAAAAATVSRSLSLSDANNDWQARLTTYNPIQLPPLHSQSDVTHRSMPHLYTHTHTTDGKCQLAGPGKRLPSLSLSLSGPYTRFVYTTVRQ